MKRKKENRIQSDLLRSAELLRLNGWPGTCPLGTSDGRADVGWLCLDIFTADAIGLLATLELTFLAAYGLPTADALGIDAENGELMRGLIALCIVVLESAALFCI
jgi:hypothetical protein